MAELTYPTPERVIEYNHLVLRLVPAKRADSPRVLSRAKLVDVIEGCRALEGDVYDKAVFLLKGLIQKHPFASGNRRTAFVSAKDFLVSNGGKFRVKDRPEDARVMICIREGYYRDEEIKGWLKDGTIREFRR